MSDAITKEIQSQDGILLGRARAYIRARTQQSLRLAETDLTQWLRDSRAVGTDHASECQAIARALLFEVVREGGQPLWSVPGKIASQSAPGMAEVAHKMANKAAAKALAEFDMELPL